ncbi:hypothetical protein ECANGB1_1846 [Enterospora canceri]|uniref:Uncharacterized protein n=1 Tax=Enterospora canceri TaxID=1081671 RepID=A0A1Y1S5G9_9MICR|nr:hypothetical protein ECANGB1_1846 [Enterospora canceri]
MEPAPNQSGREVEEEAETKRNKTINAWAMMQNCFLNTSVLEIESTISVLERHTTHQIHILILKALVAIKRGSLKRAYEILHKCMRECRQYNAFALECMAMWNGAVGRHEDALRQYVRLLESSKHSVHKVEYLIKIAISKKNLGFYSTAMEIFERILAIPEGYARVPVIYTQIYHIYLLRGDLNNLSSFLSHYKFAVKSRFLNRIYGEMLYRQDKKNDLFQLVESTKYDTYLHYLQARMAMRGFCCPEQYFERILKHSNDNYVILNTYGNYLYNKGRMSEALVYYTQSYGLNPTYGPVKYNLSLLKKLETTNPEAKEFFKSPGSFEPMDMDPFVEKCGFFNMDVELDSQASLLNESFVEMCDILDLEGNDK